MMPRLTTPIRGYDNTAQLPASTVQEQNFKFAARYLSRYTSKVITGAEYASNKAQGVETCLVFEDEATRASRGFDIGVQDAQFATAQAKDRLGIDPRVIYWAADWDASPPVTDGYADGWTSVRGKGGHGPYGSFRLVAHHLDRGIAYAWQTYAWSAGALDPRAQLHQYLNTNSFDYDHAWYADYGQIGLPSPPPSKETDMVTFFVNSAKHDEIGLAVVGELIHQWKQDDGTWHDWDSLGHPGTDVNPIVGVASGVNSNGRDQYVVTLHDGTVKALWKLADGSWNKRADGGFAWEVRRGPS